MPDMPAFSAVELVLLDTCQSVLDEMDVSLASLLKTKITEKNPI